MEENQPTSQLPNPSNDEAEPPMFRGAGDIERKETIIESNGAPRKRRGHVMPGNKYGELLRGIPKSEEWKRKASLSKMGERNPMKNPVYARKMADSKRGKPNPKHKEYWRLHKEEQLKKMMVGEHKKPNKLELRLID